MYTTFLASAFRSIRFGISEAHGRGQAIQLNFLLDQGAFKVNADGTFSVDAGEDPRRCDRADARDHDAAGGGLVRKGESDDRHARRRCGPRRRRVLDRLADVPVDIEPRFTTAQQLLRAGRRSLDATAVWQVGRRRGAERWSHANIPSRGCWARSGWRVRRYRIW